MKSASLITLMSLVTLTGFTAFATPADFHVYAKPISSPASKPASTPATNTAPKFTTTKLPVARLNHIYSTTITSIDLNTDDEITLNFSNTLPSGLKGGSCTTNSGLHPQTTCALSGTPTVVGTYPIVVTAQDKDGLTTTKTFKLTISNK